MVALVIAETIIHDPAAFEEYRTRVPATVAAFGGKYLVRGAVAEVMEGQPSDRRTTIFQFDSLAQAKAWYASPQYQPLLALRQRTTDTILRIVAGS